MKTRITVYGWYIILVVFIAMSLLSLCSCKSTSSVEYNGEAHKVSFLVDRMDSLVSRTAMWQQDIYQKQTSLVDSICQMERNDSSSSVVINERGDTVREVIRIERIIERERTTESTESELEIHLQSQVDSLIRLTTENKALTDSLLREHSKEKVIVKEQSLWQKVKSAVGGYAIVLTTIFFIYIGIKLIYKHRKRLVAS